MLLMQFGGIRADLFNKNGYVTFMVTLIPFSINITNPAGIFFTISISQKPHNQTGPSKDQR